MGKSSTTETQTATMDPLQQQYVEQFIIPQAEKISSMEFTPFQGDRVAGMTDLQRQAQAGYGALSADSPEARLASQTYGRMTQFQPDALQAPQQIGVDTAASRMSQYQDPYEEQVVQSALRDVEQGRLASINQEGAAATSAGAFGGSRQAIRQSEIDKAANQQALDTAARLRSQGFTQALGASQFDVGQTQAARTLAAQQQLQAARANQQAQLSAGQLQMGAAGGLGGLAGQNFQRQLSTLGAQMGAGEAERLIGQQGLDALYQQYLIQQQFPLTQFSALTGGSAAFPAGIGTTTGTSSTSDPFGSVGRLLGGIGSFGQGYPNFFGTP